MLSLYVKIRNFLENQKGQGMVEYGLVIGLVALAAVVALTALGGKLDTFFTGITGKLPTP